MARPDREHPIGQLSRFPLATPRETKPTRTAQGRPELCSADIGLVPL